MIMNEEKLREKIEEGLTVRYGCYSFYKRNNKYYCTYPKFQHPTWTTTKSFTTFDKFWDEVGHFFLYGVDYNGNRDGPPALDFNVNRFNPMAKHDPCAIVMGGVEE